MHYFFFFLVAKDLFRSCCCSTALLLHAKLYFSSARKCFIKFFRLIFFRSESFPFFFFLSKTIPIQFIPNHWQQRRNFVNVCLFLVCCNIWLLHQKVVSKVNLWKCKQNDNIFLMEIKNVFVIRNSISDSSFRAFTHIIDSIT